GVAECRLRCRRPVHPDDDRRSLVGTAVDPGFDVHAGRVTGDRLGRQGRKSRSGRGQWPVFGHRGSPGPSGRDLPPWSGRCAAASNGRVDTRTTIRSPGSYGLPAHEIVLLLETDASRGLSEEKAAERLGTYGPNVLPTVAPTSP